MIWQDTWIRNCKTRLNIKRNTESESHRVFRLVFSAKLWLLAPSCRIIFSHPHFTLFFHAFVVCEKVKRFFFQSKLSGLSENRTFHKANFPRCSGNIITPEHHSFNMTYGFIYKKKTSLTQINTKCSHKLRKGLTLSKKWNDINKCCDSLSVSASLLIPPVIS